MKKIFIIMMAFLISVIVIVLTSKTGTNGKFADGDGTEKNPYQVSNAAQLNTVRNDLSAHYIQTDDIDLLEYDSWEPIGNEEQTFTGTYDGQGLH